MKTTFDKLTVGDTLYLADVGQMNYTRNEIKRVEYDELHYGYGNRTKRLKSSIHKQEMDYNRIQYIFCVETDAIRFCKAQLMKKLYSLIENANKAIDSVAAFKAEHIELLNHQWTEEQINILEKQKRNL